MSNWDKEIGSILKYLESKGPNWLLSAPKREGVVLGIDEEGMKRAYCFPTVAISHTADLSNDVDIVFVKDYKNSKFKLNCTFKVNPVVEKESPIPMRLFSAWVTLNLETGEKTTKLPLQVSISSDYPQTLTASTLVNVKEFDFLAECFEKGYIYFTWGGEVRWYDVSDPALLSALRGENTTEKVSLTTSTANVTGRVDDILIKRDNETTYGAVLGTLDWEDEHFDQYVVWFKDMMTQNAYYLLPQIYWIKANPKDNSPSINVTVPSMGVDDDEEDASKVPYRYTITVSPYYHPRSLRNMYEVVTRRSHGSVRYCRLAAGGFKDVEFRWDPDFLANFGKVGIKADVEGVVDAQPGSSFNLVFQINTESYEHFHDLLKEGVKVGIVIFDNHIEVDVKLNAHRLAQLQVDARTLMSADRRYKFSYQSVIQNPGKTGLRIDSCEMTSLSRDKNGVVKDSNYGMKNTGKCYLSPGESKTVDLAPFEIQELAKKSRSLGLFPNRYWTELVCQPCDIYLDEKDVEDFLGKGLFGIATQSRYKFWTIKVCWNLSLSVKEKVDKVEVELHTVEGTLPPVTLTKDKESVVVTMSKTIHFSLFTELRNYIYRYRVDIGSGATNWSDWTPGHVWDERQTTDNDLVIYDDNINKLTINSL